MKATTATIPTVAPPWVLFDASFLAHRAMHATGGMHHNDIATGVVYGFLETIRNVCADPRIASNRVAIMFDSGVSHRQKMFPAYKRKRVNSRTPEELAALNVMHIQLKLLRESLLPAAGFRCYRQMGLESDDLLAQAAGQLDDWGLHKRAVIVTADGDLYQCITKDTVHWFDPVRNLYLDALRFWGRKGVAVEAWVTVKCLTGCATDNVPGIPGVGEKTAVDYLNGRLNPTHKRARAVVSPEGAAVAAFNERLIRLPHKLTRPLKLAEPVYNPAAFYEWCERLGIKSYLDGGRHSAWVSFFAGTGGTGTARQLAVARKR